MPLPAVGTQVLVVVDNSWTHAYMEPGAGHRSPAQLVIMGTVAEPVKWMSGYLVVLNTHTGGTHYILPSRIVSINNRVVQPVPMSADREVIITSARTGEAYRVRMNGVTKTWNCSCVGWQFKGKCKHVQQAQTA